MKAAGMLFLSRGTPRLTQNSKGVPSLTLLCVDRIANYQVEPWVLYWNGQAAADFWIANAAKLTPGTPLQVVADNLRANAAGRTIEITGRVVSCALVHIHTQETAGAA